MSKSNYTFEGDVIDTAVKMLDIEADKSLPDEARAAAKFARLVGPSLIEACETIAGRDGQAMVLVYLGKWMGMLFAGTVLPNLERAPPHVREVAVNAGIEAFSQASRHSLAEFEKIRSEKAASA